METAKKIGFDVYYSNSQMVVEFYDGAGKI